MALTAEELAGRIRRAIEYSEMTQEAVADAIGIDPSALSKALGGKRNFSTLEFARLCEVLRIPASSLLSDGEQPKPVTAEDAARVRHAAELDALLTEVGYPRGRDGRYPATLLDRAIEAWLAGQCSIRPIAGLIGMDADDLLAEIPETPSWLRDMASRSRPAQDNCGRT